MDEVEADLAEIAAMTPHARTILLLSANPLVLSYDKTAPILEKIREYLPDIEHVYAAGRVTDLRNKTVEQLRALRDLGLNEISMGTESGDDWTLERIHKGYHAADILEQCAKLDEAGIAYGQQDVPGHDARALKRTSPVGCSTGDVLLESFSWEADGTG